MVAVVVVVVVVPAWCEHAKMELGSAAKPWMSTAMLLGCIDHASAGWRPGLHDLGRLAPLRCYRTELEQQNVLTQ